MSKLGNRSSEWLSQVAEEWATARAEAAKAKAAADKPRQKAAGQVIAGLKREIAQLGGSQLACRTHTPLTWTAPLGSAAATTFRLLQT